MEPALFLYGTYTKYNYNIVLTIPTVVKASASSMTITINWSLSNATGYNVYRSLSSSDNYTFLSSISSNYSDGTILKMTAKIFVDGIEIYSVTNEDMGDYHYGDPTVSTYLNGKVDIKY